MTASVDEGKLIVTPTENINCRDRACDIETL